MRVISFEQITGFESAVGLTPPNDATMAWIQADTQNVRYRLDSVDPSGTLGLLMRTTDPPIELAFALSEARFLAATSGAILNVTYFG
jgi:hypothetical protein